MSLPLLFSCEKTTDGAIFVLMQNADHGPSFEADYSSWDKLARKQSAEDILYRVNHDEDVVFAFVDDECVSCKTLLENAGKTLYEAKFDISYIDGDTRAAADVISRYCIENKLTRTFTHPMTGDTPSMYVMSKTSVVELVYGFSSGDTKIVETAIKHYCGLGSVHRSSDINRFKTTISKEAAPFYVLDSDTKDYFYESIYPKARETNKKFYVLDITGISKDNENLLSFSTEIGTDELAGKIVKTTIESGNAIKYEVVQNNSSFIEEYFA